MTLQELKYVVAVAEERNFRRAADKVFVSQPSLSASVKKLEDELGVRLLQRTTRSLSLTEAGQAFYDRVRDKGFILYPGKLTQVETFRVGCIGAIGPDEMRHAVNAVRDALSDLSIRQVAPAAAAAMSSPPREQWCRHRAHTAPLVPGNRKNAARCRSPSSSRGRGRRSR